MKTGPLEKNVLEWVRLNCRGSPVDLAAIESYVVECEMICSAFSVWCSHVCVVQCVVQTYSPLMLRTIEDSYTVTHTDR